MFPILIRILKNDFGKTTSDNSYYFFETLFILGTSDLYPIILELYEPMFQTFEVVFIVNQSDQV